MKRFLKILAAASVLWATDAVQATVYSVNFSSELNFFGPNSGVPVAPTPFIGTLAGTIETDGTTGDFQSSDYSPHITGINLVSISPKLGNIDPIPDQNGFYTGYLNPVTINYFCRIPNPEGTCFGSYSGLTASLPFLVTREAIFSTGGFITNGGALASILFRAPLTWRNEFGGSYLYLNETDPLASAVPVPATVALLGLGLIGIGAARRKLA